MRYVEDLGTVVAVEGQKATIRLDHKSPEECGSCCACSAFGAAAFTVDVERGGLQEGDRVSVCIPRASEYLGMLLVFGLPLALFMGGIALGTAFEEGGRIGGFSIAGGLVGLVAAFLVAWLVNRRIGGKTVPEARRLPGGEEGT